VDELLTAVVEALRDEILPEVDGRHRYQLRACIAAVELVQRELAGAAELAEVDRQVFAELGVRDDQALADEIREGLTPQRFAAIADGLRRRSQASMRVLWPQPPGRR
jgi:hypothetical protein